MKVLNLKKKFGKENNLRNDTMNDSQLQRVYNYHIYPRHSEKYSDKGFVNIDDGSQGGSHSTCSKVKDNEPNYLDGLGGQPDKLLLKQLPKPIIYHTYKIQDINSKLCGSYCLCFFYLIERTKYYDAFLKLVFE